MCCLKKKKKVSIKKETVTKRICNDNFNQGYCIVNECGGYAKVLVKNICKNR